MEFEVPNNDMQQKYIIENGLSYKSHDLHQNIKLGFAPTKLGFALKSRACTQNKILPNN